jgi:6-pyruvoyltetrahydropterin/6-carboxytetrahydropterin synthase
MSRTTTIELFKEEMKFSAGHFTIFSATERENLHGHNFSIYVALTGRVDGNGLLGDYGIFKRKVRQMCMDWNETFMLPLHSPFLSIDTSEPGEIRARYADEILRFLPRDVTLLPVKNVTVEELSRLFGERLISDQDVLVEQGVQGVVVKCASGPGQWASWTWEGA